MQPNEEQRVESVTSTGPSPNQSVPSGFPDFSNIASTLRPWFTGLAALVCVALFLFHLAVIHKYSLNVPQMDDWAMFSGDNHPQSLDLTWLYAQHNDHRIATTKLFVWFQFQV